LFNPGYACSIAGGDCFFTANFAERRPRRLRRRTKSLSTMNSLSKMDLENLQADLGSLITSAFVGVLVGYGSMILHFSNGSSLLMQCPFEANEGSVSRAGHGEHADTSLALFQFLNADIVDVTVDGVGQIDFDFGARRSLRIIPENSGFESYVLQTSKGTFPVIGANPSSAK
jgi:hypothetical protein